MASKKKKKFSEQVLQGEYKSSLSRESVAPALKKTNASVTKAYAQPKEKKWYQEFLKTSKTFSDGYDVGDVSKAILGTATDIENKLGKGFLSIFEAPVDIGTYATSTALDIFGADKQAEKVKKFGQRNLSEELADKYTKEASILATGYNTVSKTQDDYKKVVELYKSGNIEEGREATKKMLKDAGTGLLGLVTGGSVEQLSSKAGLSPEKLGIALDKEKLIEDIDNDSVSGDTLDQVAELVGYMTGMGVATKGLDAVTGTAKIGSATTGASVSGGNVGITVAGKTLNLPTVAFMGGASGGLNEAYQKEDVTHAQAWTKGLSSGMIESVTEGMFGVLGVGGNELTDQMATKLAKKFASSFGKQFANVTVKGLGESFEELASYTLNWLTDNNVIDKMEGADFSSEFDWEEVSEQMALALISGGVTQGSNTALHVNAEANNIINQIEQETGRPLTREERRAIRSETAQKVIELQNDESLQQGLTEEAPVGENVQVQTDEETRENLVRQLKETKETKGVTTEDVAIQDIAPVGENVVQQAGQQDIAPVVEQTGQQVNEADLKRRNYTYVASETDSQLTRELKESASRVMNDTKRSHEFVETVSKIAERTQTKYRFTNTEELNALGYGVEGRRVNGLVTKNGEILINIDSQKALNTIIGHETTHLLEGTKEYKALQDAVFKYAQTKGDFVRESDRMSRIYAGQKNVNIDNELTSELVGDYLFTDQQFLNDLASEQPSIVRKIYNEIKHWIKMATAGSKEARQLEDLKYRFEKALNSKPEKMAAVNETKQTTTQETKDKSVVEVESNTQEKAESVQEIETEETSKVSESVETETKIEDNAEEYSLSVDNKGRKLTEAQVEHFEDSVVRDENGNLLTMYHGTSSGGYTIFDPFGGRPGLFGQGSYFTADNTVAESYTEKGRGNNKQIYEVYLNITKPIDMDGQANVEEWKQYFSKHIPEATFPESGTNEALYRFTLEEFENTEYDRVEVAEIMVDTFQKMGYDGITHIGGGRFNQKDNTRHRVYITFESNQIKEVTNKNPTEDSDIRYSLSESTTDNQGRKLSEGVVNWSKDSKVRDEDGNLLTVYHGTEANVGLPEDAKFTVFDINRAGSHGSLFGNGFYFTSNKQHSEDYSKGKGNVYEVYLNIKNPFKPLELDLGENINNFYDVIEQEFKNQLPSDWDSLNEYQKGKATRYILEDNGYDGIFVGDNYIAFNSNQIKNVDNTNPTESEDIRYSLSEDNEGRELSKEKQEQLKDSKFRDENGNIKVMYHGTKSEFDVFDINKAGGNYGSWSRYGRGFYFTDKRGTADFWASEGNTEGNTIIKEKYLNATNPFVAVENYEGKLNDLQKEYGLSDAQMREGTRIIRALNNYGYDSTEVLKKYGFDGVEGDGEYVVFDSEQIIDLDNTTSVRYSLSEDTSIEDKINSSMTMAEAKKMIQIAFQVNDINNWYDNKYVDGDDWLNDVGVDEVATYVENTLATIQNYLNPLYDRGIGYGEDFYLESILEAYQKGELKGSAPQQATRLDTSVENDYKDERFYAPQTIEADIELYNKANQRVTSKNSQEVYKARGQFIIAVHQKGYAEQLGLTQEEVNKKLKTWAGYNRRTLELSNEVNEGIATQNRWTGLENSSIVNTVSISNEDLSKMVKEIKGDSSNWQRQYITSTMLALDTHIDYSPLTFEFDQHQALSEEGALGDYNRTNKTIRIGRGYQNTVAHEIGHYIDNKWAEEFGFLENSTLTQGLNFDSTTLSDEVKQFNKNFQIFMDDLVKSATVGYGTKATYYQNRGEVFARFVGKFVEWTKNQATNNRYGYEDKFYTDNFTERQYREFIKLLQEKSMLDTTAQYSLSELDEDIAPVGNYNVYGSEVGLQKQVEEAIAPLQEKVEELTKVITDLQENIAPATFETAEEQRAETQRTLGEGEAPLTEEGTFTFLDESPIEVKNKRDITYDIQNVFNIKHTEAREIYNKIANMPELSVEDIYTELEKYKQVKVQEQDDYYKDIQNYIKGTKLDISEIKKQITDYDNVYRMANMGKGLTLANSGQSIDSFYQELNELYPNVFPDTVTAEADQLDLISQVMFRDTNLTYTETLDDDTLQILAEKLYSEIGNRERYKSAEAHKTNWFRHYKDMLAPGEEAPIKTDISYEDYVKSLDKLPDDYAPYLEQALEINASNTEQTVEDVSITNELNRLDTQMKQSEELNKQKALEYLERLENEPTIVKNPFDEILDNFLARARRERTQTPVQRVEKSKLRNAVDTGKRLLVNEMAETDNLAHETGNLNIKFKGDMLNSVAGEIEGEIYTAQTDNYGRKIGESVSELFAPAKESGLYEAFDDYLAHYTNIDRHLKGKGSVVPADLSQKVVAEYEKTYPQFKDWGAKVWRYGANARANYVDAGLISQETSDYMGEIDPHYVPFIENRDLNNYFPDLGEIKARGFIKRAVGGANQNNLLLIEEALTKYTFAEKKAVRQNQFYQEIVRTLSRDKNNIANIGADVRKDASDLETSLYRDETGNYLTAYFNGQQKTVRISDDLYTGLKNDLKHQIEGLEQKFAIVTDPVQKISEIRRNLLTSWSPMFIIRNPIMDIQDAVFNSKYTKDFLKHYNIKTFMELGKANTETARQFLTLYGSGNVMGEFSSDGSVKNSKFLKGIQRANNIMELAPRFAEFKASLDNGASIQEAMYNAREVTTNFSRGGTITKALNKNGFTFLNVSVQGFDKFIRNFSGENGAKGVAGSLLKAVTIGVLPALFNELAFGGDDDEKDEDYDALPDYIKDNYYLFKTGDGEFIRIPKGRILSVFGSAARRTLEYLQGEEDAFEGFLKNANSQIGVSNPLDSNILTPLFQAFGSENGEAWYGGDIVPKRLQDKAPEEQYDASTDKFSIWLGDKIGVSPYKINYVLDQYSGGIGDIFLPMITDEATNDAEGPGVILAPIKDAFTSNSTFDNKYAGDIYDLSDKMDKLPTATKETDEYKIQDSYLYSVTSEMAELYAERREVQANKNLSKKEKYAKVQEIQKQINSLAKEGLDNYQNVNKTDNYAIVGGREFNKYTTDSGEERWGAVFSDVLDDMNSMGMDIEEKSEYFKATSTISSIQSNYEDSSDYVSKKRDVISIIKDTNLNDEQKAYLYDKYYGNSDVVNAMVTLDVDIDSYLDYESQNFEADKDSSGKSISGSKKRKVFDYINSMPIDFEQRVILAKLQYPSYDEYNAEIVEYLNSSDMTYEQEIVFLEKLGFKVDEEGYIYW